MLSVKVETVFDDGIVVSYTNKSGVSFRGALLPFKTTRSTESLEHNHRKRWNKCEYSLSESHLANPLATVHDHQYTDMKKSVNAVLETVPMDHLLNWGIPNDVTRLPKNGKSTRGLQSRFSKNEAEIPADSLEHRSAVVLCDRPKMPTSFELESYLPLSNGRYYRKAKVSANVKLHEHSDSKREDKRTGQKTKRNRRGPYQSRKKPFSRDNTTVKSTRIPTKLTFDKSSSQISLSSMTESSPSLEMKRVNVRPMFDYEQHEIPMKDFSIKIAKVQVPIASALTATPTVNLEHDETGEISVVNSVHDELEISVVNSVHDELETPEIFNLKHGELETPDVSYDTEANTSDCSYDSEVSTSAVSDDIIIEVD